MQFEKNLPEIIQRLKGDIRLMKAHSEQRLTREVYGNAWIRELVQKISQTPQHKSFCE